MLTINDLQQEDRSNGVNEQEAIMTGSASEQILRWFENYVASHHIQVGDALPSEDQIVLETGMSRTSVREAMTRLRALGIIDSRRKRGMILKRSPILVDLVRMLAQATLSADLLRHVTGFLSALEIGMESEIFSNVKPEDIESLREIYRQMTMHVDEPYFYNELDEQFHETLIRVTGNKLATWVNELFQPYHPPHNARPISNLDSLDKHQHIIFALEKRDPVAFHYAMREHHLSAIAQGHSRKGADEAAIG